MMTKFLNINYVFIFVTIHELFSNVSLGCHVSVTMVKDQWRQNCLHFCIKILGENCHQLIAVVGTCWLLSTVGGQTM